MESLVVRAKELASLLNVSLVTVRRLDAAGKLPKPVRLGGCVAWNLQEIRHWIDSGTPTRDRWEALKSGKAAKR